jgi:hypothetical protein
MAEAAPYPVTFAAAYPERSARWKTLLRVFLAIPVLVFWVVVSGAAQPVVVASWLAILVRGRMPRWLFDFQVALYRWGNRAAGYLLLLTDRYPPFDGDWAINYDVRYPERLARWKLLFWKVITAIPHFIIVAILLFTVLVVTVIAWFFILIAGRYPRGLYDYVVGVMRWGARVQAYVLSLTDEYPPFNLSAEAGPAGGDAYLISSILGFLLAGGAIAGGVVAIVMVGGETEVQVSYQGLQAGRPAPTAEMGGVRVTLLSATDPLLEGETLLEPEPGRRLVMFRFTIANDSWRDVKVRESDFKLRDQEGEKYEPELVVVAGHAAPQEVQEDEAVTMKAVFELPEGVAPTELKFAPSFALRKAVKYVLR